MLELLIKGHQINDCKSTVKCRECNKRHQTLSHHDQPTSTDNQVPSEAVINTVNNDMRHHGNALLQVIVVNISNKNHTVTVNALLDSGADSTIIDKEVATALRLQGINCQLNLSSAISATKTLPSKLVSFLLSSSSHPNPIKLSNVWVVDDLNIPFSKVSFNLTKKRLSHIQDLPLLTDSNKISLIIGADMPEFHLHLEYRHGNPGEPIGIKTKLGWVLFGGKGRQKHALINKLSASPTETLTDLVEKFWEVESYSTESPLDPRLLSKDEKRALEILEQTTTKKQGKYEVGILWKDDNPSLPNNRALAIARMINMERKFKQDPKFHEMYAATINDYIKQGHAIKVTSEKSESSSSIINYLPHHGVRNINKPGRVRVVFDVGAKFQNTCLNDNILKGPDLLNNLLSVLLKFREGRYGVMSDIQQMFHQVLTNQDDQQALRFLWRDNPNQAFQDYAMTVHVFGKADSPCCANWALKRTALDQKKSVSKNVIDAVLHKFYMDDYLDSFNDITIAVSTTLSVSTLLEDGGFHLTKWTSNSIDILNTFPKDDISPKITNLDLANLPIERVLGILWNPKSDQINVQSLLKNMNIPNVVCLVALVPFLIH